MTIDQLIAELQRLKEEGISGEVGLKVGFRGNSYKVDSVYKHPFHTYATVQAE